MCEPSGPDNINLPINVWANIHLLKGKNFKYINIITEMLAQINELHNARNCIKCIEFNWLEGTAANLKLYYLLRYVYARNAL